MLGSRICLQLCIPAAIAYTQKTSDKADADVSYRGLGHGHYQHDRHGHHKRHILKRDGQGISLLGSSTTNTSASSASLNISAGANTITEQTEGSTTNISSGTCPNGTAYTEFTDNFAFNDASKWTQAAGDSDQSSWEVGGLTMILDEKRVNIVFHSVLHQRVASSNNDDSFNDVLSSAGVVCPMIFKNDNVSNEIDLELVEYRYGRTDSDSFPDATVAASTCTASNDWIYSDPSTLPGQLHEWTVAWSSITWSGDAGRQLVSFNKLPTAQLWITEPLHVRFGPWVAGGIWAGTVDWVNNPNPSQQIKQVVINGCSVVN
ncbi:MAG: hypothetical protein CYPHOPRED_006026 [Cyphobasidiales sp. Tagirdzhanova-0007]|nr:MAG: hypothetical protein CYPHOPRED_006026 [Cyphobasidiales sp. Tagirdzhanova-0007]